MMPTKTGEAKDEENPEVWRHIVAGAFAGWMTALISCPLDVIKVRLQTSTRKEHPYTGILHQLRRLWCQEGIQGLYRGLSPTMLGLLPSFSIYFTVYQNAKVSIAKMRHCDRNSDPITHVLSAMIAGGTSNVITNPIWVLRTRMMTQHVMVNRTNDLYHGMTDASREIYQREGVRGFFKGAAASLLGITHVAVQFPLYEYLKRRKVFSPDDLDWRNIILASGVAKLVASGATYPHEIIRTRLQVQRDGVAKYSGIMDAIRKIYHEEGFLAFYRGFRANIIRVVPASCTTFITYEFIMALLS